MATTAKTVYVHDQNYGRTPVYIATNENYIDVYCTAEMGYTSGATSPGSKSGTTVSMQLQRYTSGSWKTIDSFGAKSISSGSKVTNRFTNIAKKGAKMRVKLFFGTGEGFFSGTWTR